MPQTGGIPQKQENVVKSTQKDIKTAACNRDKTDAPDQNSGTFLFAANMVL